MRTLAAAAFVAAMFVLPEPVKAQDPLGAIVGGAIGAGVGAAVTGGRAGGAIAGGIIGAAAGSAIAFQPRAGGYYWYDRRCWYRYPNGEYHLVSRRNCG